MSEQTIVHRLRGMLQCAWLDTQESADGRTKDFAAGLARILGEAIDRIESLEAQLTEARRERDKFYGELNLERQHSVELEAQLQECRKEMEWRSLDTAPRNGKQILLLIWHQNYYSAQPEHKCNWEEIVEGSWANFNGGGWTWRGMSGTPQAWKPIDAAMSQEKADHDQQ